MDIEEQISSINKNFEEIRNGIYIYPSFEEQFELRNDLVCEIMKEMGNKKGLEKLPYIELQLIAIEQRLKLIQKNLNK